MALPPDSHPSSSRWTRAGLRGLNAGSRSGWADKSVDTGLRWLLFLSAPLRCRASRSHPLWPGEGTRGQRDCADSTGSQAGLGGLSLKEGLSVPRLSRKLSQEPGEAAGHTEASRLIGLLQTALWDSDSSPSSRMSPPPHPHPVGTDFKVRPVTPELEGSSQGNCLLHSKVKGGTEGSCTRIPRGGGRGSGHGVLERRVTQRVCFLQLRTVE